MENQTKTPASFRMPVAIAFILLACAILIPMYDVWAGIIPTEDAWTTIDTIEIIADEGMDALYYRPILLQLGTVIPGLLLLISTLAKKKGLSILFALIGIICPILVIAEGVFSVGIEFLSFVDGCISIGYYVTLILFAVAFIQLLTIKR